MVERTGRVSAGEPPNGSQTPPHDLDIERSVIGAMLVNQGAAEEVLQIVAPEDFYSETHSIICKAISEVYRQDVPVDQLTVTNELRRIDEYDKVGGRMYVFKLVESVPTAVNATIWARIVKNKAILRKTIDVASRMEDMAMGEPEDLEATLERIEGMVHDLSSDFESRRRQVVHIHEWGREDWEEIQRNWESDGSLSGITTGFTDLDKLTGGWQKGDLVVLAARASMGKTALAVNFAQHAGEAKENVLIFELEMDGRKLHRRILSRVSKVPLENLSHPAQMLEEYEFEAAFKKTELVDNLPIHGTDSPAITISTIRSEIRRLQATLGREGRTLGLVIVDYLQLMKGEKKAENRQIEVAEISRDLKVAAKEMDVCVIAIAQCSRSVEYRADKRPILSDLKDSGALEQDADLVLFVYRDEYYDEDSEDAGQAEIICRKQRNGPTGTVKLAWREEYASFENLSRIGVVPQPS